MYMLIGFIFIIYSMYMGSDLLSYSVLTWLRFVAHPASKDQWEHPQNECAGDVRQASGEANQNGKNNKRIQTET